MANKRGMTNPPLLRISEFGNPLVEDCRGGTNSSHIHGPCIAVGLVHYFTTPMMSDEIVWDGDVHSFQTIAKSLHMIR
jgi:hypothetical protein